MSKCPGVAGHKFPLHHSFIEDAKLGTVVPEAQNAFSVTGAGDVIQIQRKIYQGFEIS